MTEVVLASARQQLRVFLSAWRFTVVLGVVQPAVLLLVTLGGRSDLDDPVVTARTAAAVVLTGVWSTTVWAGAGILRRERVEGTLATALISVRDVRLVIVGKSLGSSVASATLVLLTVSTVLPLMGRSVKVEHPWWLAAGMLAALLSAIALGSALSCLFVLTRHAIHISSALMYPVFLLGGLLLPLSSVPAALRWLSWPISLRWANDVLRAAVSGTPDPWSLGLVLLLTVGYAVGGALAFNRVDRLVRQKGTLDLV